MASELPCGRERCVGPECGHFNDPKSKWFNPRIRPGCEGWTPSPWAWAKWYLETFGNADKKEVAK